MASPELWPADGSPWMATAGMPLKRSSLGGPKVQRLVAMAEREPSLLQQITCLLTSGYQAMGLQLQM